MSEWQSARLGNVADMLTGYPFKSDQYTSDGSGIRLIRGDNIVQGCLRWDGVKRWPASQAAAHANYALAPNDVVLAMDRPWIEAGLKYATIREADCPSLLVQRVTRLRGTDRVDGRYLSYVIGSADFTRYVLAVQTGTAVPHISGGQIKAFEFALPAMGTQVAIAAVLTALDDKIELNRRMNETLEASARALFRDWFVDFGPTRAKAEGRPAYLAPDLWSLFPDRLGEDGLPVGWRTGVLSNIIDVSPPEPLKRGVLAPYLDMAALPTSGPNAQPAVLREYASGTRFRNGDTLLARITPCLENGKTAFVQALPENTVGWGSTEFIVLRAIWPVPECVPYLVARDDDFRRHAIQSMTGTSGRQRASADAVTGYPIALPPDDRLWRCLSPALDATFERIARNAQVSQALANTRDGLLPKLMSGELRVREAEALAA